jgi:hypothetical protein
MQLTERLEDEGDTVEEEIGAGGGAPAWSPRGGRRCASGEKAGGGAGRGGLCRCFRPATYYGEYPK